MARGIFPRSSTNSFAFRTACRRWTIRSRLCSTQGISVECCDRLIARKFKMRPARLVPFGSGPAKMNRSENSAGIAPAVLHHVNFPGRRPTSVRSFAGHQPQRRPITLTGRQFGAEFEFPILLTEQSAGFHSRGRKVESPMIFFYRYDVQDAIADESILGSGGVILQFMVTPSVPRAAVSDIKSPVVPIDGLALKLVTPDQPPIGARGDDTSARNSEY